MSLRTRIKFCGITRIDDVRRSVELGVDAIGLVFTRSSQRFVGISQARVIRNELPAFVTAVALFMDDEAGWIEEVIASVQPDILQFHGAETDGFASSFARPYIKAVPMGSVADIARHASAYPNAAGLLLDSHARGARGGTGATFDWTRIPAGRVRLIPISSAASSNSCRRDRSMEPANETARSYREKHPAQAG